jgi:SAM-dependent methyltransferase
MSGSFGLYSHYYDLLYADKDYAGEVDYVLALLAEHAPDKVSSILELGCGTGIHATLIAKQGLGVLGVDMSADMLAEARARATAQEDLQMQLSFDQGDARDFRANRRFDAVVSLFHVLSYQSREVDLQAMMQTATSHLESGGIFVFDFWYGPAVLWQRPAVRMKRLANQEIAVERLAEPVLLDSENVVDVNYSISIRNLKTNALEQIKETHRMRYLFLPEVDKLLSENGFVRLSAEEWMTGRSPSVDSWGVCVVAAKN